MPKSLSDLQARAKYLVAQRKAILDGRELLVEKLAYYDNSLLQNKNQLRAVAQLINEAARREALTKESDRMTATVEIANQ